MTDTHESVRLTRRDREQIELAWDWSTSTTAVSAASIHGPVHWRRVARLGLRLARMEGADMLLVALFAACHDVAREHDGRDLEHGPRAAEWVQRDLRSRLTLEPDRWRTLLDAIRRHTDGETSEDPTVGCCWDADRLDLVRIGFDIDDRLLSTGSARTREVQRAANRLWKRDRHFRRLAGLPIPPPLGKLFRRRRDP